VRLCSLLPSGPTPACGPGLCGLAAPHASCYRGGVYRVSQGSQATLVDLCHVLRPRRDWSPLALAGHQRGPRSDKAEGSPRVKLSRLNSTALVLAVYASSSPLRCRRRKTRFRWLARPCRVGLVTHRVATKGFKDRTSSPPFLSFPGAMSVLFPLQKRPGNERTLVSCFGTLGGGSRSAGARPAPLRAGSRTGR
jgi:hypothetical protein